MKRDINVIGIDIAKRVFHVIGMDTRGTIIFAQFIAICRSHKNAIKSGGKFWPTRRGFC